MTYRLNLALQGGGAHGAFTWGVLDVLLQDDDIEIAAITGTSAGALNGAALKSGFVCDGREGARANLDWLWGEVMGVHDMRLNNWIAAMTPDFVQPLMEFSPAYQMMDAVSRMSSPYAQGPFYSNPLDTIVEQFTFDAVQSDAGPDLFVCATNVRSGKVKVFGGADICKKAVLASACLPTLFQAVEIDGKAYWDGGYTGNPALFPLFDAKYPDDLLIVNINPLERLDVPKTPQDIQNRINEISFNTSLLRELRAIEFVQRLIDQGTIPADAMKRLNIHMIADDKLMQRLSVASKTVPQTKVILELKAAGQDAAHAFLDQNKAQLGKHSTVDLQAMFN
ncbi:MAG: patatin-like phospholipase family protein [Planktomarina sp.]